MNITYLIIIYNIVCIFIILFNVIYIISSRFYTKDNNRKYLKWKNIIKEQLNILDTDTSIDKKHAKYLFKKLKNTTNLLVFDEIINHYLKRKPKKTNKYLNIYKDTLFRLSIIYSRKNSIEKSFYTRVIRNYNIVSKIPNKYFHVFWKMLQDNSIYCRDNAYFIICRMGNSDRLLKTLEYITNSNVFFHKDIIQNGLNIYNGDSKKLLDKLWDNYNSYNTDIQCCIIDLSVNFDNKYASKIIKELSNDKLNEEIYISCLNYFTYIHYEPAEQVIYDFINKNKNNNDTLYYYAIQALRNYNSSNSIKLIEEAIVNGSFKIKDIACESLAIIRLNNNIEYQDENINSKIYLYHINKYKRKESEN